MVIYPFILDFVVSSRLGESENAIFLFLKKSYLTYWPLIELETGVLINFQSDPILKTIV